MSILTNVNVWAIVGDSGAGKSTMIGHLTAQFGATKKPNGLRPGPARKHYTILLRGGGFLRLWSRKMALQEAEWSPEFAVGEISNHILRHHRGATSGNILIALRDVDSNGFPEGHEYLNYFQSQGWTVRSLVLIQKTEDPSEYWSVGAPVCFMNSAEQLKPEPDNLQAFSEQIAHRVGRIRNHFEWA
jgi:GTPase SAR1 family protein